MTERQIEKQKETEVKEHNNLVDLHGITIREDTDTESEHFYYKPSQSQAGDSMAINGHNKVEIRINNKYASLIPELTREEHESLKESIKQDGLWVPLIVNQDGVLFDGHHRYKVCQELGINPHYIVKEFKDEFYEKLFVIDCNIKRRQLNNFQRIKLALKSKSIKEEIARKNSQSNLRQNSSSYLPTDRNLTVDKSSSNNSADVSDSNSSNGKASGRVDEQIGEIADVSRDTVRKVEKILQCIPEESEIMQKLMAGDMSINQAHELIFKEERLKQKQKQEQQEQYLTAAPVTYDNIIADSNGNTTFTSKSSSHPLGKKEEYKPMQPLEKPREEEDLVKKQNYQMKQEIQALRERVNYLEQIKQQEEEWSRTYIIDLIDGPIPLKIGVNSVKQEIVYVEVDFDYIKNKKQRARERYRQQEQEQEQEQKEI